MTRALTQKSVASDLVFTRHVNAICNEGIRGLACFSAYLGPAYLLYGSFISRALYLRGEISGRASVRAFCAVGWLPHAPLSCFVLFIAWPSSHNLGCASEWRVSTSECPIAASKDATLFYYLPLVFVCFIQGQVVFGAPLALFGGLGFLLACRWDAHKHLSLATIHLWHRRPEPPSSFEKNDHRRLRLLVFLQLVVVVHVFTYLGYTSCGAPLTLTL
jgi:hypothetical protein